MNDLKDHAERGDVQAQFILGMMHLHGHGEKVWRTSIEGVPESKSEAKRWFLAAAKGGFEWGMYDYAKLCEEDDPAESYSWFCKAAMRGLPDAQVAMIRQHFKAERLPGAGWAGGGPHTRESILYSERNGAFKPDIIEAYKWALIAAQQNHPAVTRTNEFEILECRMSDEEIAEAKSRADSFYPTY